MPSEVEPQAEAAMPNDWRWGPLFEAAGRETPDRRKSRQPKVGNPRPAITAFTWLLVLTLGVASPGTARSTLHSGDLLIADDHGTLLVMPGGNGAPVVFSSGGTLWNVMGVAVGPQGEVYVSNQTSFPAAALQVVRVDPVTGARQIVSEAGLLTSPVSVAVGPNGWIYVADQYSGAILRIDPASGSQSVVNLGLRSSSIAMGIDGLIYAAGYINASNIPLVAIDPTTGARTTIFSSPEHWANSVAIAPTGKVVLLTDFVVNNQLMGNTIYSIDPVTKSATVVADLAYRVLQNPRAIVVSDGGAIFVTGSSGAGSIVTGTLYVLTGLHSATPLFSGGLLDQPFQMAVYHGGTAVPVKSESWGRLKVRYR